jgi:hypothetical protein
MEISNNFIILRFYVFSTFSAFLDTFASFCSFSVFLNPHYLFILRAETRDCQKRTTARTYFRTHERIFIVNIVLLIARWNDCDEIVYVYIYIYKRNKSIELLFNIRVSISSRARAWESKFARGYTLYIAHPSAKLT